MSETNKLYDAVRALARQAEGPNLPALSYALRHPETWPEGFVWDYGDCRTCAMGLAVKLWGGQVQEESYAYLNWISVETSMPYIKARKIFFELGENWKPSYEPYTAITPDDVADAIDQYLAAAG